MKNVFHILILWFLILFFTSFSHAMDQLNEEEMAMVSGQVGTVLLLDKQFVNPMTLKNFGKAKNAVNGNQQEVVIDGFNTVDSLESFKALLAQTGISPNNIIDNASSTINDQPNEIVLTGIAANKIINNMTTGIAKSAESAANLLGISFNGFSNLKVNTEGLRIHVGVQN